MYSAEYEEPQATGESSREGEQAEGDKVRAEIQSAIAQRMSNAWTGPRPYSYEDEEWKDLWHWAMTLYWEKAWENLPATPENEAWKRTLEWMYHTLDEKR